MIPYHVTFQMPAWIAKGIADGTMEIVGGVVRRVDGKQVVMWLRAGAEGASMVGAPLLRPLGALGAGAALSAVAVVGVGIVVVGGFMLMKHYYDASVRRLEAIMARQDQLLDGINELRAEVMDRSRHAVATALETIRMEEERGAFDALQQPISVLRENGKIYISRMERLIAQQTPLAVAPFFVEFATLFAVIAQAKARALTLYQGIEAAEREAIADQAAYAQLWRRFMSRLQNPADHLPEFARLTEKQDADMRECLPRLPRPENLEYIRLPGLTRDPILLKALLDVMVARADEPTAGIIPVGAAPDGWTPASEQAPALQSGAQR